MLWVLLKTKETLSNIICFASTSIFPWIQFLWIENINSNARNIISNHGFEINVIWKIEMISTITTSYISILFIMISVKEIWSRSFKNSHWRNVHQRVWSSFYPIVFTQILCKRIYVKISSSTLSWTDQHRSHHKHHCRGVRVLQKTWSYDIISDI